MMEDHSDILDEAKTLIARLERISADSIWARRSSGLRGALLKWVEVREQSQQHPGVQNIQQDRFETEGRGPNPQEEHVQALMQLGYEMLEKAIRERMR